MRPSAPTYRQLSAARCISPYLNSRPGRLESSIDRPAVASKWGNTRSHPTTTPAAVVHSSDLESQRIILASLTRIAESDLSAAPAGGEKIRIAMAITDLDIGGAERAFVELATRLPRDRFEVRVWSLTDPANIERSFVPTLQAAGIPVVTLGARRLRDGLHVIRRLAVDWREWHPHLVQTFLFHANLVGRVAVWRAGCKHVVAGIRVAERRSRWRLRLDRVTASHVERWVCVSRSVANFSQYDGRLPSERLVVIPNGIDVSRYDVPAVDMTALGISAGRRVILYVGRLDEQKGLAPFLRSARAWLDALPEHDLLIVGDGPLRDSLSKVAAEHCPPGRVHFAGWRADVPALLAACDMLVLPSLWEGMPNVVLEAMAARRPVLSADVEGVRELLGPDAEQQIASPAARQWHEKLRAIAGDHELAMLLGERNRRRAETCFTLDAMARAYAELYVSLVQPTAADIAPAESAAHTDLA